MSSSRVTTNRVLVCGLLVTVLSACGHDPVRRLPIPDGASGTRVAVPIVKRRNPGEEAAVIALRQIGVPYRYGGSTVQGFDCSGLVQYAYASAGKKIPRTTAEQWRQLTPINSSSLRVGDLLFFRIEGKVSHVGMYLGDRRFVHAPSTGREVSTASLDSDFYRRAFVRAARPD
jgi:cell wall-associated NlpC family hydrolase